MILLQVNTFMSSYFQMQIVKQLDAEFSFTKIKYSIKVTLLNAQISWKWKFEQWDTWQLNRIIKKRLLSDYSMWIHWWCSILTKFAVPRRWSNQTLLPNITTVVSSVPYDQVSSINTHLCDIKNHTCLQ